MKNKDLIVLIGESGSGKTTVLNELEKRGYNRIVTYTTRPPRKGEKDGRDYHFISENQFLSLVEHDFFVEHALYRGWRYGTAEKDCRKPNTCIAMTPAGMRAISRKNIRKKAIYLNVDRRSRLLQLLKRGDDIEEAYRRSLSDVGQFDGVEREADLTIDNPRYEKTPGMIADIISGFVCKEDL